VVILNPEYGERMGEEEALRKIYRGIGDFFKKKCQGYTGYVFTGNLDLAKRVGLRTKGRLSFYNGPIECRLLEYDLYEGSQRREAPSPKLQAPIIKQ
jgi:putative N6-adenine-specific DNA methylase